VTQIQKQLILSSQEESKDKSFMVFGSVYSLEEKKTLAISLNDSVKGKLLISKNIKESHEKEKMLSFISESLSNIELSPRVKSLIDLASDELIMNAFFNAPKMGGIFMYKNIDRKVNVFSPKPINVSLFEQEHEVVLSVKDFYGSLDSEALISKIKSNILSNNYSFPKEGSGAGVGLSFLALKPVSLIIKVLPNISSEVLVFFPKKTLYKEFSKTGKVISIKNL